MNRIYKLVWNSVRQAWVVASECCRSRGKAARAGGTSVGLALAAAVGAGPALAQALPAATLPTQGQVTAGRADVATSGASMTITQSTDKAILQWQGFSIGSGAGVTFVQPGAGSVALNRVVGNDPSLIMGRLSANGQVFLVNPNGVLFGQGARVDVGGLVASTMALRDGDFLAGRYAFRREGATASVVNQGELTGRYVALLAPEVRNEGVIAARMGTAVLAAGDTVTLGLTGNDRISVEVERSTVDTLVENRQLVQADGGTVVLSAQSARSLLGRVVNTGTIAANGISSDGGTVRLVASSAVEHAGAIQADAGATGNGGTALLIADLDNRDSRTVVTGSISARGGSTAGDGGFVETSASHLSIGDGARVDTRAAQGRTGRWLLDPVDFTIAAIGGDITGAALSAALASNDVTIETSDTAASCSGASCGAGASTGNGDIFVNDTVSWGGPTTLTLSAWRNVEINAPITVGTGGRLTLAYGVGSGSGTYLVSAPVNLAAAGSGFRTIDPSFGTTDWTVIRNRAGLEAIASGLTGSYVLGTDIDLSTGVWTPIGNWSDPNDYGTYSPFTGMLDGLGHSIANLTTDRNRFSGLFGVVGGLGLIQNLGLRDVNVTGHQHVGAIAGYGLGTVFNSYVLRGTVGTNTSVTSGTPVGGIGGLVGTASGPDGTLSNGTPIPRTAQIRQSYANVAVLAGAGDQQVALDPGVLDTDGNPFLPVIDIGSPATLKGGIGGLVGVGGVVTDSYAKGNVEGGSVVGGLVGYSDSIASSYVTNLVKGNSHVGKFIGGIPNQDLSQIYIFTSFFENNQSSASGSFPALTTSGAGPNDDVTAKSSAELRSPSTFTAPNVGWVPNSWELRNGQYPLLRLMLQPLFVSVANSSTSFTGAQVTSFPTIVTPGTAPASAYSVSYTSTGTPVGTLPINVGSYLVTPTVTLTDPSDQHGYRVQPASGTLTITPAVQAVAQDFVNPTYYVKQATETSKVAELAHTFSSFVPVDSTLKSDKALFIAQAIAALKRPSGIGSSASVKPFGTRGPSAGAEPARTRFFEPARGADGLQGTSPAEPFTVRTGGAVMLPAGTFRHSNPDAVVSFRAELSDGGRLPDYLEFNPTSGALVVLPSAPAGKLEVKVVGKDDATGKEVPVSITIVVPAGGAASSS